MPTGLEDAPHCSVPLIFDSNDDTFRYWFNGTGFLVALKSKLFLITARHCLRDKDPGSLRILSDLSGTDVFSVEAVAIPQDDEDYADFAILSLSPPRDNSCQGSDTVIPFSLDTPEATAQPHPDNILVVRGFPGAVPGAHINYDTKIIHLRAALLEAKAAGFRLNLGKGKLDFAKSLSLDDLGGLSGSPVFIRRRSDAEKFSYHLCGVMIQGSGVSRVGHFVAISLIMAAMEVF